MRFRPQRLVLVCGLCLALVPVSRGQLQAPAGARFRLGSGSNPLLSVAFSPDGAVLALGGYDNSIELWESARGTRMRRWETPEGCIATLAFSPDGRLLASGGVYDNVVHLWDPATGAKVRDLEGLPSGVTSFAFSPDGKLLAAGGYGTAEVLLWEVATAKEAATLGSSAPGPTARRGRRRRQATPHYSYVAVAPDGKTLASGHTSGLIRFWDLAKRSESRKLSGPETDPFVHLAFSPDGEFLASWGQAIRLRRLDSLKQTRSFGEQPDLRIAAAAFSPDGRMLASASSGQQTADELVHVWETATGAERCRLAGHDFGATAIAFSPDGQTLATASRDGTAILWDMKAWPSDASARTTASQEELEGYWHDLAHNDAGVAYRAIRAMSRAPRQATSFLETRLSPPVRADAAQIQRWIANLDSKSFKIREDAEQNLAIQHECSEPLLRSLLTKDLSPEAHRRLEQILKSAADGGLVPHQLQFLRAIEVLEIVGTTEALKAVTKMAAGDSGFRITREAKESLVRLKHLSS